MATFLTRLRFLFQAVLLAWLLIFCFQTGNLIVNAYNPLPEMDYWETVPHLAGYLHFPPVVLWEQHYEHRVIFPELVFAFDWLFLKGRELLPLVLIGVLDVGVWIILILAYRRSTDKSDPAMWCALLLAGILMAWPGVAFVLAFPFSLQFVLYQFSTTASLWALSRKRVDWAIALGVIATFSSANGLLIWPLLIFLGSILRLRRDRLIAILCVGTVSAVAFFRGYHNLGNTHSELIFSHAQTFFGYFVMYLGMPFGAASTVTGLVAGTLSLILFTFIAVVGWRRNYFRQPIFVIGFGVCMLTLATAWITTVGRFPTDNRPFEQAIVTPGRYVNFAIHYWAALSLLLVWTAGQIRPKFAWAGVLSLALFFAAVLFRTDSWVRVWMGYFAGYQYATLAIESGLATEDMGRVLNYTDGSLVNRSIVELERRHLALYSWDRYKLIGMPLSSLSIHLGAELQQKQVTAVQAIGGGVRIIGWAKPKGYLVVADEAGTIVGLGRHLPAGETSGIPIPQGHPNDYWVAFAGPTFQQQRARLFLLAP